MDFWSEWDDISQKTPDGEATIVTQIPTTIEFDVVNLNVFIIISNIIFSFFWLHEFMLLFWAILQIYM